MCLGAAGDGSPDSVFSRRVRVGVLAERYLEFECCPGKCASGLMF